jgi:RIO-like serine/threonine protein kinase
VLGSQISPKALNFPSIQNTCWMNSIHMILLTCSFIVQSFSYVEADLNIHNMLYLSSHRKPTNTDTFIIKFNQCYHGYEQNSTERQLKTVKMFFRRRYFVTWNTGRKCVYRYKDQTRRWENQEAACVKARVANIWMTGVSKWR